MSIAAAFRDRMIYAKAYGTADLEHRVETRKTTAFRTASVAKPLTATAVMTLVETGRLDLDAPIRTYGGAWPEKHPVITVRQVLGHLAGIRHYAKPGESAGKTHYFTLVDSLAFFKDDAVIHEPGTKYQPVWKIRPLDSLIDRSIATRRFLTQLIVFFGASAALLALLGLYAIVASGVAQRTREIGVRIALGATHRSVLRLVLRTGLTLGVLGNAAGLGTAIVAAGVLRSVLFGISARDP